MAPLSHWPGIGGVAVGFQITVGGVDVTQFVDLSSVQVDNNNSVKADLMSFDVYNDGSLSRPLGGNEVIFLNGSTREFAGVVITVDEELYSPGVRLYRVTCKDYTHWFDHRLVVEYYTSTNADTMVRNIINSYVNPAFYPNAPFTTNHVQAAPLLADQRFDYLAPSDAIKQLADLLEWQFWVDYHKDVHFAQLDAVTSPLPNNTLNVDTDTNTYHDLKLSEDVSQIKNRIYLRGFNVKLGPQNFNFNGDGQTTWFPIGYSAWDIDASDFNVSVNGKPQNVMWDGIDGNAGDGQTSSGAYVCQSNQGIRFNTPPGKGDSINGSFNYGWPQATAVDDPNAQQVMAQREGSDGVYEHMVNDPSLSSPNLNAPTAKGLALIYKYGYPKITGEFGSYVQGWFAGQYFYLTGNTRMVGNPTQKLYVIKVRKTIVRAGNGQDVLHYTVSISDSPWVT